MINILSENYISATNDLSRCYDELESIVRYSSPCSQSFLPRVLLKERHDAVMKSRTAYGEAANAYGVALDKMVDELLGVEKEWPYKITEAYRQGKLSYNNGDFRSHNPYTNTTMCADWFKGFDEGRKLS